MVCRDFILPEPASYVFFYAIFNLRNLLYIITVGSNGRVAIYKCYNRTQHKEICDGPTTYRAEKVDAVVSKLIRDILQKAGAVSEYDIVRNQIGATASDLQQQIRQAKLELSKKHTSMLNL